MGSMQPSGRSISSFRPVCLIEEIVSLKVQFTNFIEIGKQVDLVLLSQEGKSIRAVLCRGKLTTVSLFITLGTPHGNIRTEVPDNAPTVSVSDQPANFTQLAEMAQLSGWLEVPASANKIERYFPNIASAIGSFRIWAIALLSRLVGMICPGLYSLFGGFTLELEDCSRQQDRMGFQVSDIDERFRMVGVSTCLVRASTGSCRRSYGGSRSHKPRWWKS